MPGRRYYVYMMASLSRVLYVGVTNDLVHRVWQHKNKELPGFTEKYHADRLVYAEDCDDVMDALTREKQIKGWRRSKKIALIESINPGWDDLAP